MTEWEIAAPCPVCGSTEITVGPDEVHQPDSVVKVSQVWDHHSPACPRRDAEPSLDDLIDDLLDNG